ncbi:YadA-like family protein [Escherichia coli]|uniref:YadA-like family protein n=1 Tax=Escherichia coli TaxID=562 RepID=UPI0003EF080D|nr:YadA-like family protein [Escherichia coli]EFK3753013.1 adhesin [Escherichia coli]EGT2247092.1 adhesin [Escherichia coli]EIN2897591.1 YadA-like family protein [Escherichia coli]EIO7224500.1 YadA-like family protein [Escherichia coli]EIR2581329.1 YadA-like family protein [Escherichia coli]
MNKIFKVIWNPATGSYSVASETAKSRGKKSGRSKLLISALIVTSAIFTPGAYAGLSLDGGDIFESTPLTNYWLAIGQGSVATTNNGGTDGVAMAIGLKAKALGAGSTAFGYDAEASGDRAIAFGQLTEASGNRTIAMGSGATATGDHSLALGGATKTLGMYSVAIGRDATTDSDYALSMGHMAKANGLYSLAMGAGSATSNDNAIAIGKKTQAQGVNSIALGNASQASGYSSLAIGELSETGAENAIALGKLSNASKINSIALGSNSTASGEGSVALGENSFAGGINSLALGSQSNANGDNAVALGVGSVAAQDNTVSVGNSTTQRKITNMAAGQIRNGSTEAINGSQLYGLSDSVAARLGGGAGVNEDGSINAPSYKLKSNIYNNVGDALLGIDNDTLHWDKTNKAFSASYLAKNADGSLKERSDQNKIINVAKGTISATSTDVVNGSQLYDLQQDALLWNGTAFSAAHGSDTTSKITNVAKGTVSATSTDVVNGSQLYDLQQDALLWNGTAFSAAHGTEATSKITNVEDGTISDTSKDAVNGSQLKETKDDVATNTANIADNTADIATNTTNIADNTADIATNTTDIATNTANIADNTANIATNTTDIATNTADIATNASSITTLNADVDTLEKDALLWNGTAFSAKHGTEATSKITNVTAGDLTAGSTDAVNGSQLKTTNDNVSTNTTNITNLTDSVGDLKDDSLLWNKAAGAFSAAHGTDTTSKITNVRAGSVSKNSTDAINGSQLYGVADSFTSYLGGGADISDTGVLTGPTYTIGDTDYTNVGDALAAINTSFSSSLGDALLWDATAGKFSAKHGINNDPSVITDVANGAVSSTSSDAINGSQLYGVSDYIADALGGNAVVNADGSITTPTYAIAGGSYDNVGDALEAIDTTLDDALLWDETANGGNGAFSAAHGKDKTASVITNVANGAVSATSSDAINGSQLYSTNKYIADALGGDAEVNADGTITAPTYTIANTDYNNVGEALDALDNNALLWDATANNGAGAYSASHDGKASIITNVADGNIGEDSTDAINGSQLNATNMMIQQNSEIINQLAGDTSKNYIGDNGAGINYVRTNDSGLAFNDASAAGIGSTAVGYNTVAKGDSSVAIGHGSNSIVETSIALGSESVSSRLIVKGSRNTRVTENGVEIGYDTTDGELLGALSIGDDGKYRQIINVADGSEAHDAVTVRQLQNAIGAVATTPTKYYHANSTAEDSLAVGEDSLAMGAKTIVNGNAGIGIGLNTLVLADAINGIAIGSNARANHADSIAMGNGSQTTRGAQTNYTAYNMDAPQNSVGEFSVGSEDGQRQITNVAAGSADTDAVNVGQLKVTDAQVSQNTQSITNLNTQVTNLDTRVTNIENGIGDIVTTGSTKYFKTNTDGADANAQGKDSVAIGSGSIAAADNSVALGTGSVADEENTISVGSSTNQRRITNVAAGVNATDAVNVSQLKSSEAGGVRYDTKADGSIDYSNITLGGGNGGTTRISNVSAGVNNNDAVNYAQLKQSVQETKQYTDQRMVEMDNKLSKTESKLSGGIASAMAMTGLPQAYTPGASMASIGGGTYNGESAVALGVSMVSANGRWVYKLQGSTNSQGEYSAALGAGIQW